MADTALAVMTGVMTRLKAFTPLTSLTPRIYSAVPQQQVFPFVSATIQSMPFAANDFSGQQHNVRVQAHSQSGSMQEALAIRQQVMAALDRQEAALSISGLVKCEFAFADCFIEDAGKTWQSVIEFTLITM